MAGVSSSSDHSPLLVVTEEYSDLFLRSRRVMKPVRTPVAIFGSLGVCIYVPTSRHGLISYSPIHLT